MIDCAAKLLCVVEGEGVRTLGRRKMRCRLRSADHVLFTGSPPSYSSREAHSRYLLKWLIICGTSGDWQLGPLCF